MWILFLKNDFRIKGDDWILQCLPSLCLGVENESGDWSTEVGDAEGEEEWKIWWFRMMNLLRTIDEKYLGKDASTMNQNQALWIGLSNLRNYSLRIWKKINSLFVQGHVKGSVLKSAWTNSGPLCYTTSHHGQ